MKTDVICPVGNSIFLAHIWILHKILGRIWPILNCFKRICLKSKYPNRVLERSLYILESLSDPLAIFLKGSIWNQWCKCCFWTWGLSKIIKGIFQKNCGKNIFVSWFQGHFKGQLGPIYLQNTLLKPRFKNTLFI